MTRLLIRVSTAMGPRTLVTQDLAISDAWAISNALDSAEIENRLTENANPLSLKDLIKRRAKHAKSVFDKPILKPTATITKLNVRKP